MAQVAEREKAVPATVDEVGRMVVLYATEACQFIEIALGEEAGQ